MKKSVLIFLKISTLGKLERIYKISFKYLKSCLFFNRGDQVDANNCKGGKQLNQKLDLSVVS